MAKEKTPHIPPDRSLEDHYLAQGYKVVCGTDDAGRGPLAGPVAAAAVILPQDCEIEGLNDSKKLTEKKREALYDVICREAIAYAVAMVDHQIIDEINILEATYVAMRRAVEKLPVQADFALVDGNRSKGLPVPFTCVVGGDAISPSNAAASVLAKVTRDRYMLEMDQKYPEYGFAKHKGYGSKAHYTALLAHGACPIHRRTFLKKFYAAHPEAER